MKTVDELGIPKYNTPHSESIGPNMNVTGQCTFNTECPIGFSCDVALKACVK